jgi:xylan 1,4-beta-xylosidase
VTTTASGPIQNPVLRGFYPDPSICRVGDDYYIANSTFEWFPGVALSHSRDLVHWEQIGYALTRSSQLDMRGDPNSGGIWAPCLTHADGLFWLIYTDVRGWTGPYKDVRNYLVTSPSIDGPWSEPAYLNGVGFDPSLFHDDDGRKWYVQMTWDHRPGKNQFHGIVVQEYDVKAKKLVGPSTRIFGGTALGKVEGPHLLKRNGWYYLTSAEGGTFVDHAETVARSKNVTGPYEEMPGNPLISAAGDPANQLHSSGHGCLVETPAGEWYLAHLCRRPIVNGRSVLGRETAIQKIVWDADGWPRLAHGGVLPAIEVPDPGLGSQPFPETPARDDFDATKLAPQWQSLRLPLDEAHYSLTERPGHLRLKGRESIISEIDQTVVARRQRAFHIPDNFYYMFVTSTEDAGLAIGLMGADRGEIGYPIEKLVDVSSPDRVYLRVEIDLARLRFYHSNDGKEWVPIGDELDASILSDEYGAPWAFTGNFVGMACQDLTGSGKSADFDWFEYREL